MEKIVTMGGGTGHFQILKGLKNYECEITAIVNMSDNGGSSGRLRDEYGILPPGDIRQCMVALASEDESLPLRQLFNYRLKDGHSLGNLIITAATDVFGGSIQGIKTTSKILGISGKVLPVTIDNCQLVAEKNSGLIVKGEVEIGKNNGIKRIWHEPKSFLYKEVAQEIRKANKIVICPGDLYTSIIPNLIVEGMSKAIKESNAIVIVILNLMTKPETHDFTASQFIKEIEKYSGIKIDKIILNNSKHSEEVMKLYLSEDSKLIEDDLENDSRVIRGEFAYEYASTPNVILRHSPEKIANTIIGLR